MADFVKLDIVVNEEDVDPVLGVLARRVSFGWEEESPAGGETRFRVYCEQPSFIEELIGHVRAAAPLAECSLETVPGRDWTEAWREFFTPVPCGRFVVLPPWLAGQSEGLLPVVIDPKSAFGTGHHATTALCLKALSQLLDEGAVRPGMRFFDLGTGSGVLGIACALSGLGGAGSDIDPLAVDNARENAALNHVQERFRPGPGSVEAGADQTFDLVLANILAAPLRDLAPEVLALIRPGGHLILSGILEIQADAVEAAYAALGPALRLQEGEWVALVFHAA